MKNTFPEENKGIFAQFEFDMTFSKHNNNPPRKSQEKKKDTFDFIKIKHFHMKKKV